MKPWRRAIIRALVARFCRRVAVYHLGKAFEAERAREFFRGTEYQYELNLACQEKEHHWEAFKKWLQRYMWANGDLDGREEEI